MRQLKIVTLFFLLLTSAAGLRAQNNTSPYSVIGIGDIEKSFFDRSTGMANTGISLSSNRFLYQANPASYSALDNHFFNIEVATRFKGVTYSGTPITSGATGDAASDLQFKKVVLATKIKSWWGVSLGLLPFSTSNYSFSASKAVVGTSQSVPADYEGSGSTNQFYLTNSFRINKNFSVGVQASYLFGQLLQKETLNTTGLTDSILITSRNLVLNNFYFTFGAQYHAKLSQKLGINIGVTASPKTNLRADYNLQVQSGNTMLIPGLYYKQNYFALPVAYAAGISATLKDAYIFALDYSHQDWNSLQYSGLSYNLVNSDRISGGFEYSSKTKLRDGSSFEKYFLQSGLFYDQSYLKLNGTQLKNYGMTVGGGFSPARFPNFGFQASLEVGVNGTTNNGLIRENYTQFNLTLTYRDLWIPAHLRKYD